jgi:hypothetical protein
VRDKFVSIILECLWNDFEGLAIIENFEKEKEKEKSPNNFSILTQNLIVDTIVLLDVGFIESSYFIYECPRQKNFVDAS